jgi:superfamily II DNA or RNA helicase
VIHRPYQLELSTSALALWTDHKVVLIRLDTGGGKTPILSYICEHVGGFICAVAHRDKLVEQISMTLARAGIKHDLIASDKTKRIIAKKHLRAFKQSFYAPGARCRVASVDTLVKAKGLEKWAAQVKLWIVDEGHHVLRDNKWGRALGLFTHEDCKGLLLTATPRRGDGKGLGSASDGYADIMIEGPPMRWLIDEGYLCDYDVVCPPSVHLDEAPRGKDGDYTDSQRVAATQDRQIIGDVPKHYLLYAAGKSGITFAGNIKDATDIVSAYRATGVTAELITGNTDPTIRDDIFDRAESGRLNQIVAVDVISEGVDIPALLVGSFARLTGSLPLWMQQIGRLLRPYATPAYKSATTRAERLAAIAASPKPRALLIDHVGGFTNPQLGPPDKPRVWSLDPPERRADKDEEDALVALRVCANPEKLPPAMTLCLKPYPRIKRTCPHCGYQPVPVSRGGPEFVEGDLELMDPAALAELQGRSLDTAMTRADHDAAMLAKRAPSAYLAKFWSQHLEKCQELDELHASMDRWAGQLHAKGLADHEIQRAHYVQFGVDVLTPGTLKAAEMRVLKERIDAAVMRG